MVLQRKDTSSSFKSLTLLIWKESKSKREKRIMEALKSQIRFNTSHSIRKKIFLDI